MLLKDAMFCCTADGMLEKIKQTKFHLTVSMRGEIFTQLAKNCWIVSPSNECTKLVDFQTLGPYPILLTDANRYNTVVSIGADPCT